MKDDIEAEAAKEVSNANEEHLQEENIEHNKGIMINIKQLIEENKIDIENIKDQIKLKVQFDKRQWLGCPREFFGHNFRLHP